MKPTKKAFESRCRQLGVTWINNGFGLSIDTPIGKAFAKYGSHSETVHFDGSWKMAEIYAELLYVMSEGLEDCLDENCEICQ